MAEGTNKSYVQLADVRDFLQDNEAAANTSDQTIQDFIDAGAEMIDGHCHKHFVDHIPALVKTVNKELVRAQLADASKSGESLDDYSYTNDPAAFSHILARLGYLPDDDSTLSNRNKEINVRVI